MNYLNWGKKILLKKKNFGQIAECNITTQLMTEVKENNKIELATQRARKDATWINFSRMTLLPLHRRRNARNRKWKQMKEFFLQTYLQ